MSSTKVLFIMADYGHDPTETAIPFKVFRDAGFDISFATENGSSPECDKKMLEGWTGSLLGAPAIAKAAYAKMREDTVVLNPISWSGSDFSLESYDLLFFPGGHDKAVRQILDSDIIRSQLAAYWPKVRKNGGTKAVAAVCHGVLVVSETTTADGKSILHDVSTTTLPNMFESGIWWATRAILGDYYKTYGKGSSNCEEMVKKRLDNAEKQFKGSTNPKPFVVEDENYNYISARFPNDAQLLAENVVALMKSLKLGSVS